VAARDPIFIKDGQVWTSAGVTARMDLVLVDADLGRGTALTVARELVLYLPPSWQPVTVQRPPVVAAASYRPHQGRGPRDPGRPGRPSQRQRPGWPRPHEHPSPAAQVRWSPRVTNWCASAWPGRRDQLGYRPRIPVETRCIAAAGVD